jgi:hypothetical protein
MFSYNRSMLIWWNRHGVTDPHAINGMTKKEATLERALKELKGKVHLRYYKPVITKFIYEYGLSNLYTSTAYHQSVSVRVVTPFTWKYVVFKSYTGSSIAFNMLSAERQLT